MLLNYVVVNIRIYYYQMASSSSTGFSIGVPSQRLISASHSQKATLEILLNLQTLVDEFKVKVVEMEDEMRTIKIENNLLKNKIAELTSNNPPSRPPRRGLFGYGEAEF